MADFELEQLKTLFESLGERLDRTRGDQLTNAELSKIRGLMAAMARQISQNTKDTSGSKSKDYIDEFWKQWKAENPFKDFKENYDPKKGQTIIQQLQDSKKGLNDYSAVQNKVGSKFIDRLNTFNNELGKGTTDLQKAFRVLKEGGIGGAAGSLVTKMLGSGYEMVAERAQYYRDMLASGEGSVTSMQDLGRRAAEAGLTVEQFTKAMTEGTQGARSLGAIKFGEVRKSVLEITKASGYMGMLPGQITEVTSAYAEILRNQGGTQNRTNEQMAAGILNLVKTSETTAHILGKTREEALEAQKLAAADYQFNAIADSKGFNAETANAVREIFKNNFGDVGVRAITDQLTYGQVVNKSAADLVATNPDLQRVLDLSKNLIESGANEVQVQTAIAQALKENGQQLANNKSQQQAYAQIAGLEGNALQGSLLANLQNRFVSQGLKTDTDFNRGTDQNKNAEQKAGVGVLQLDQVAQEFRVAGDALKTAVINPMVDTFGPSLRDVVNPALTDFAQGLTDASIGLSKQTGLMATLTTGAVAAVGAVAGLLALRKGAAAINIIKTMGKGSAAGAAGAAGSAGARAGIVGAGAAGGAAGAGTTILSRLRGIGAPLGRVLPAGTSNVLGKTGSMLGKGIKGGAGLGAAFESIDYLFGDKAFTGKNLAKSALRVGGGALGAIGGSFLAPGAGTIAGGIGGSLAGDKLADMIFGADDIKQANASATKNIASPQNLNQPKNSQPANASPNQKPKNALSMDQMTQRIMDQSEKSASYLKQIKVQSEQQTDLLREEISVLRNMSDRLSRLLEDGNKNTRSIADHSL